MVILSADENGIKKAVEMIFSGDIILWPSGGVYGFACDASKKKAVEKIYSIKARERGKALPVLANQKSVAQYGKLTDINRALIDNYWPGYLGMIVEKTDIIPNYVTANKNSVALVCPNILSMEISNHAGIPLAVTSANISGSKEIIEMDEAIKLFDGKAKAIIEAPKMTGTLNTLIDFTCLPPKILREGGISRSELKRYLAELQ